MRNSLEGSAQIVSSRRVPHVRNRADVAVFLRIIDRSSRAKDVELGEEMRAYALHQIPRAVPQM